LVICALVLDVVGVAVVASLNDNPAKKWTAVVLYVVAVAAVPFPAARWFGRKRGWPRTSRTPLAAGISMMLAVPLVLIGYLALTS
ncbi:MAG TPA: hypothetical protein VGS21_07430, partial [Acidimicrobiales bacterium]|nr:hypothetical protein [Acidimicrobiales bacterium]